MKAVRTDSVEMHAGISHLPEEFREVALLANKAGLEGYEFVDAEVVPDIDKAMAHRGESGFAMPTRLLIKYRTILHSRLHSATDQLLAWYLMENRGTLPSTTSVMDLMKWSHARMNTDAAPPVESGFTLAEIDQLEACA